ILRTPLTVLKFPGCWCSPIAWEGIQAMNRGYHERMVNTGRYKWHPLFLVVFLSTLALAQSTSDGAAVCPLSESQSEKSIDAFAKIVPTLTQEPRCVNCHGGVNPFMD